VSESERERERESERERTLLEGSGEVTVSGIEQERCDVQQEEPLGLLVDAEARKRENDTHVTCMRERVGTREVAVLERHMLSDVSHKLARLYL